MNEHVKKIEEILYCEIILACENVGCSEIYQPKVEANDPMAVWALENSIIATNIGWEVNGAGKVQCPSCSFKIA